MPLLVKARSFLRNIFLPHREDVDLDQEVRSHLELLTEENIRAGMPPHEAQRSARIQLGGVEQVKEQVRDSRTGAFLDSLIHDLRFALRQMRRSPGFAVTAVLILTLGIAANDQSPLRISRQPSPCGSSANGAVMVALITIC